MGAKAAKYAAAASTGEGGREWSADGSRNPLARRTMKKSRGADCHFPHCIPSSRKYKQESDLPNESSERTHSYFPVASYFKPNFSHCDGEIFPYPIGHDLALKCLSHVPLSSLASLRAVARSWRDAIDSGDLFHARDVEGLAADWLFAVEWISLSREHAASKLWLFHPEHKKWVEKGPLSKMKGIRPTSRMAVLGSKIIFFGGSHPPDAFDRYLPVKEVWELDVMTGTVKKGSSMNVPRDKFASAVIHGRLFVAGGIGEGWTYAQGRLFSAEMYNPATCKWLKLPDMPADGGRMATLECQGAAIGNKFFVRSCLFGNNIDVFDVKTRSWSILEGCLPPSLPPPFYVRMGCGPERQLILLCLVGGECNDFWGAVAVDMGKDEPEEMCVLLQRGKPRATGGEINGFSPIPIEAKGFPGATEAVCTREAVYIVGSCISDAVRNDPVESVLNNSVARMRKQHLMPWMTICSPEFEEGGGHWSVQKQEVGESGPRWPVTCAVLKA